jgi:RNA polymerase sigma-70 factor, ECF subfamily
MKSKGDERVEIDEYNFVNQMKKKNEKALEFVVDNYSNLVFKVARSVLNTNFHGQSVEDCMNDVFWAVWINIESFDPEKSDFKYWLAAVAKYKAIDYKRKLYRQSTTENMNMEDFTLADDGGGAEKILIVKENREELLKAINDMKDKDREIFIRRYFLYEEIDSIAKTFSVDRNLVDKRLSRGRIFLKEKLLFSKGEILG